MNSSTKCNPANSFYVAKAIQRYQRDFGASVLKHLEEKMRAEGGEAVGWDDIHEAVGRAYMDFYNAPRPATLAVEAAMADIAEGRTVPIREVINDLRRRDPVLNP